MVTTHIEEPSINFGHSVRHMEVEVFLLVCARQGNSSSKEEGSQGSQIQQVIQASRDQQQQYDIPSASTLETLLVLITSIFILKKNVHPDIYQPIIKGVNCLDS